MASRNTKRRGPPDFTFPPNYSATNLGREESHPESPVCIVPQNPSPRPNILPDIMTPLTPLDLEAHSFPSKLLTIPLEIRLQIYSYVLLSYPIQHPHLASTDTSSETSTQQELRTNFLQPLGRSEPTILTTPKRVLTRMASSPPINTNTTYPVSAPSFSLPHLSCKLPTGLLASCSQIYSEARLLPFQENHFVFANWFWTGVYAAKQFTRGLRPWQSEAVRYVGLEVQGGGLGNDEGKEARAWRAVCGVWGGVWGLRLVLKGGVGLGRVEDGEDGREGSVLDVRREWVIDGLVKMKSLRVLELEIDDANVERCVKLGFCRELEQVLRREDGAVKVVFVERVDAEDELAHKPGDKEQR